MPERPPYPGRPAQPPGQTFLAYSPDGKRLLVAGCGNYARSFNTNDDGEPDMIPEAHDDTLAVAAGNDYAILGCEDGTVCQYLLPDGQLDKMLVRCALPIRDIALSPDGNCIAVCSDEIEIKLVNRHDMELLTILKDHPKPIKHLTFNPAGTLLAASCADGIAYVYSVSSAEPTIYRAIDGVIRQLETWDAGTSRCVWHPDGRVFACATTTRDIATVSVEDGAQQRSFTGGHMAEITSIAWSHNGALLASSSADDQLVIWETKTQQQLKRFNYEKILNITWHNGTENLFNWTNSWGEAYIIPDFLKDEAHIRLLKGPKARSPFYHDPLDENSAATHGQKALVNGNAKRAGTPDSLDELLGPDPALAQEQDYDWIEDDDGAGYTNGNGKRSGGHLGEANGHLSKRQHQAKWQPRVHPSFQPGSTPWRGNRKYLCLNLTGFVWTVDQDTHNTVTVEFYDREMFRDFHFTDPFLYDKACLNEHGALFSCPSNTGHGKSFEPSMIFYRPHEIWTGARSDTRIRLPIGEEVTCIALSEKYIFAITSAGYVRVWTLFGTAARIWRTKTSPTVVCTAWGNYIMIVRNGGVGADGSIQLVYDIEDVKSGEVYQNSDLLPLGAAGDDEYEEPSLKNCFWSDSGDPCAYDSKGVLCVLQGWRTMGQARWVPLLDTRLLDRLKDGRKEESYWPVAVVAEKFHCIILKGGDKNPYFPRPLLSEFDLRVPINIGEENQVNGEGEESNVAAASRLEEVLVRSSVMLELAEGLVLVAHASHQARTEVARRELEVDKILLQLLAVECREGEEKGMKALEIVGLMRDRGGKMVEAAAKVAGRYGRNVLEEKIRDLGERRLMGLEEE